MSARRQVEGRRVHYSKEDPELEHYHRYQSPSPGPRHRQQLHPGDSRVHRSRRTYSDERDSLRDLESAHYNILCDEELQYNA